MTTTWPRYRSSCEFLGDEAPQCAYTFEHSCQGAIENEGRVVGTYPGHCHQEEVAPALPVKSKDRKKDRHRDLDRERDGERHRDRERTRDRDRDRDRDRERERDREKDVRESECVDCAASAPNGAPASLDTSDHHGRQRESKERDNMVMQQDYIDSDTRQVGSLNRRERLFVHLCTGTERDPTMCTAKRREYNNHEHLSTAAAAAVPI